MLIALIILLSGAFYPNNKPENEHPDFDRKDYFLAEVCQKPAEKAKSYQTILLINNETLIKPEKIVAYFSKVHFDSTITTGDQLIIIAKPQKIKNAGNPFEFDYQALMHQRKIWYSAYLDEGYYLKTNRRIRGINYLAEQIRDRLVSMLAEVLPNKEERSVVSALTLGYRTEIDQNTIDYFASTGAMHVLSVSGLHVALIYMILGFFLTFLKRGKTGLFLFSAVMISFLWIYAFITGFSPPVQRATVMFTFVIIGNSIRRPANIYNSLMASALFLILLNPSVIFDIGFQLSYLAIFGIVMIQPVLYNLLVVSNPLLKWSWGLFTVSVAAQLTTFPLGLYYFNQFPNLFWLSNFLVIPVTTLIIWFCLAYFIAVPFHGLAAFIGIIIQKLTALMLISLKWIDAMPIAVSKGIVLTSGQVWLLFGCISAIIIFAYSKRKMWLFTTLLLFILFQFIDLHERKKVFGQNVLIVYNTKNLMIHLVNGRTNYLITSELKSLTESEKSVFTKVCYRLRLAEPELLEFRNFESNTGDLRIDKNQISFINSRLNLIRHKANIQKPDQIEIILLPENGKGRPYSKLIFVGNQTADRIPDKEIFRLTSEGAFYCQLIPGKEVN
jgi:competence protein ComEC